MSPEMRVDMSDIAGGLPDEPIETHDQGFTFVHDSQNNLLSETDPEGKTWTYTYDSHNNPITEAGPGGIVYVVDEDGYVISRVIPRDTGLSN
jgi:YD repeat-containing protein